MSPKSYQAAPPRIDGTHGSRRARPCQAQRPPRGRAARREPSPAAWVARGGAAGYAAASRPGGSGFRSGFSTIFLGGSGSMRIRLAAVFAVLLLSLVGRVPGVWAAAEVHRLNLVFSATPTHVKADDFNAFIDDINRRFLDPQGLEPLDKINLSWLFDAEVRYFARQNLAVSVGAGRLSSKKSQEYLPSIGQSIVLTAEISSIPIHAGAAYYFTPYNQGDFQARAYVGAGFMSLVENVATFRQDATGSPAPPIRISGTNDGPG